MSPPHQPPAEGTDAQQSLKLELLKLHSQEVWFQVQMNWDRAKSSLAFHVTLLALIGGIGEGFAQPFAFLLLVFVMLSALLCAGMLSISHGYYRNARDRRAQIEAALGIELTFATTGTMRGEKPRAFERHWPKVNSILLLLHGMLAAIAAVGAWLKWPFG